MPPLPSKGDATFTELQPQCAEYSHAYNLKYNIQNIIAPPIRSFFCPKCDTPWSVKPVQLEGEWLYRAKCPDCKTIWSNKFKVAVQCPHCSKLNYIWTKNPRGKCSCSSKPRPNNNSRSNEPD